MFLSLACVVAVKVFKKTTPNGKVTVYLGKRDFVDHIDHTDPIDGVIVVDNDYLKGRKVYGELSTIYRYGREEDEVMGVKFSKEMTLVNEQLVPSKGSKTELTSVQERLISKFGANAYPFTLKFPNCSPSSVAIQSVNEENSKPLGVEYSVRTYVGENAGDKKHKRSSVSLAVKKLQYAPPSRGRRLPSTLVSKGFTFSQGKINLEVTLDKEIYYHGEQIAASVVISNNSRKSVKNIKAYAVQHCEVTMVNNQFSRHVATLETREGCPVTPGAALTKVFYLTPNAANNKDQNGVALDGYLKDEDVNLASSTLVAEGQAPSENMGIVISYSIRIKLNCGNLAGEITADVPFKLLHPAPGSKEDQKAQANKKAQAIERGGAGEDNIIFEDFSRFRPSEDY